MLLSLCRLRVDTGNRFVLLLQTPQNATEQRRTPRKATEQHIYSHVSHMSHSNTRQQQHTNKKAWEELLEAIFCQPDLFWVQGTARDLLRTGGFLGVPGLGSDPVVLVVFDSVSVKGLGFRDWEGYWLPCEPGTQAWL